jgi:hypothetical protein
VQQKQGRVKATLQMKDKVNVNVNVNVNDNIELEKEADVMGEKAKNIGNHGGLNHDLCSSPPLSQSQQPLNVQKRSSSSVIQRNVTLTVNAGIIEQVVTTRAGESGIFGGDHGDAGDHTTAHVVFRNMIRNQLIDQPLAAAPVILRQLHHEIWNMPGTGHFAAVPDDLEQNFYDADDIALAALTAADANANILNVQAAAQAIMNFRNTVPLSAIEAGGTGAGEGPQAGRLNGAEHAPRTNPAVNIEDFLNIRPFNGDGSVALQIETAICRQLDTGRISQELTGDVDEGSTPGLSGDYEVDREEIADQHLQTIALAYPTLWAIVLNPRAAALRQNLIDQMGFGDYTVQDYKYESDYDDPSEEEDAKGKRKRKRK